MDPTDSRLVNAVQRVVPPMFSYRMTVEPTETFTLRYVPVLTGHVLDYILLFLGGYVIFAYLTRLLGPRSQLGSMVKGKFAWACLVLFPVAMFYEMVFAEEAAYNAFLWTNFSTIFALGALGVLFAWFEVFLYDRPVTRRVARFLPRKLKNLLRTPAPPYIQAWLGFLPFYS